MSFEKEFKIFSQNINQAARSFYYHQEIQSQVHQDGLMCMRVSGGVFQDSKLFQAMNLNAQFWNDYKYSSIVYSVITLGRIFDTNLKSHSISKLLESMMTPSIFTKPELQKRKFNKLTFSKKDITSYMSLTHEFAKEDFFKLKKYIFSTKAQWKSVKNLRNKIYAHQDIMSDDEKKKILDQSEYKIFDEIISRLLTVEHVLREAYINGYKPDYSYKNSAIKKRVREDTASLLQTLASSLS